MARPVTISDDEILEAARALLLAKGPQATTSEIAARAGVSEGTLFKRFGSKAGLLRAAMTSGMVAGWIERQMRAEGPLRSRRDFKRFIRKQVAVLREIVPMVVMAWSSRSQTADLPADLSGPEPPPLVAIATLAAMIEEEMEAGHLARHDPEATARIMLGAAWYHVFLELVFQGPRGRVDEDVFVEELARVVFADLDPERGAGGGQKKNQRKKAKT